MELENTAERHKKILIIATGGAIASVEGEEGSSPTSALGGEQLVSYVPEIAGICGSDVV